MQDELENAASNLSQWWDDAGVDIAPLSSALLQKSGSGKSGGTAKPELQKPATFRPASIDRVAIARERAASCKTLDELIAAISTFDAGSLSLNASKAVIARGNPKAEIMLIGEAPGRDEDRVGKPFVGRSGQFLDKMFASIGLGEDDLYITNAVFWRPKGNRTPDSEESAMCLPFVERHISLLKPKILVSIGGSSTKTLLATDTGITRLRGKWAEYHMQNGHTANTVIPLLPIFHPAFVLRKPISKRECWQDLLSLRTKIDAL